MSAEASDITKESAISGGNVLSDGGAEITSRGVCWSTSSNPTMTSNSTSDGTGTGVFVSSLINLMDNTKYYVRAFATNSAGTNYGKVINFITKPEGSFDYDGRTYTYRTIGTQVWMTENLAFLPSVSSSSSGSDTEPNYYVYNYEGTNPGDAKATSNYNTYGVLYNWEAAKTACPPGWHLPNDGEWKILEKYQGMSDSDANATGWRNSGAVGKKLKEAGNSHWENGNGLNSIGFSGLPGGYRIYNGGFYNLGKGAMFWTSSAFESLYAWRRGLYYTMDGAARSSDYRSYGFSVRCIKD